MLRTGWADLLSRCLTLNGTYPNKYPFTISITLSRTLTTSHCRYSHQDPGLPLSTRSSCRLLVDRAVSGELSLPHLCLCLDAWEHWRVSHVLPISPILKRPATRQLPDPSLGRISLCPQLSAIFTFSISIVPGPANRAWPAFPVLDFSSASSFLSAQHLLTCLLARRRRDHLQTSHHRFHVRPRHCWAQSEKLIT